uniref:Uncharacterized protein n=1 Tax=Biomphalaria glabrata TaxID=6526 RepID=A0A2C9KAF8_BIOGL
MQQERLLADAYDQSGNKVYYSVHQTNINRTKALYLACSSNITSIDSLLAYFISIEQNNTKIVELQHTARLDTFENSQVQVYYPMIKMDGQILSDEEVDEYMQSKILNLTKYLPCHLTNVLHRSDTIYLYPIILVLCLLFFIFIVAVILVKYQRYTYHKSIKSKDTSLTNSVHSVFIPVYGASLSRSENKIAAFQDEKTESK